MNIENLTENIQSVIKCAKAIEYELENNSGDSEDAKALYETLEGNGVTTDGDEIVAAVELVAELSSDDAAEINSALELWSQVEGNGHNPDDIETALDVYAIVEEKLTCIDDLDGALQTSEEWSQSCGHTWADPAEMAAACEELSDVVEVFVTAFGRPIGGAGDANEAVRVLGNAGVSSKEQALLDAIKAFCEPA